MKNLYQRPRKAVRQAPIVRPQFEVSPLRGSPVDVFGAVDFPKMLDDVGNDKEGLEITAESLSIATHT
jgi:hypothetical protein